ncbi:PleD family two-component system response regulator [Candidatus Anaplasma sp. TIGMIC]|uniref:PleD family two-component system response regulator n=1 Tax=Candidatus Anaplasma sp. TIGMIC TaxID=3020713 RepID=UPI00232C6599|nr:PleD family two-component system response regulator [Candidatus Anaplasma sp. TIGMIC]MDB1135386.1 PleD family two-component system response regulator [Candidatus Anaplasma sp. TIGMIC]
MTARILVVDDLLSNIKLLQAKLTREYYSVLTATNGPDAISIAQEQQPDLVLLDVMMPGMDGHETCRRLRANPSTTYIPIVMVTALDNTTENRVNGLNAGADDFLTKPIDDVALFARIKSLTRFKILVGELRIRGKTMEDMRAVDDRIMQYANQISDGKILVIDEDRIRAESINSVLQKNFQETAIFSDPTQTFNLTNAANYDLLIIDMRFGGDGLRLYSDFRNYISETRFTPVLLLLDESENTAILQKAFDMGVIDYITVPICNNELIARVSLQIKRKRYQDALRMLLKSNAEMSIKDPLTGCYNRRYFDMYFQNIVKESREKNKDLSIIILDIDHFKQVNDTLGHTVGDEILKQMCDTIFDNIRVSDLLARFGGEEFVVILPETNIHKATQVAERLRQCVEMNIFATSAGKINKTLSIGVAKLRSSEDPKQLLTRADELLYVAKKDRNRVVSDRDS